MTPWEAIWNDWGWVTGVNFRGVIHGITGLHRSSIAQNTECYVVNPANAQTWNEEDTTVNDAHGRRS
jgi:hypothetical protein